jgi:hypothetical protein
MGYASIDNLYKTQRILEESHCYAMEKIHGTSSHITHTRSITDYTDNVGVKTTGNFHYHGGGVSGAEFKALFDTDRLELLLCACSKSNGYNKITIYGESYGGKMQKNQWRYGSVLKFCAFEVNIDDRWLTVPEANSFCLALGIEFVHFVYIETKLSLIDEWRDAPSTQAERNGVYEYEGKPVPREGVVLRTVDEKLDHRGNRIIAKHKRDEERETKTPRKVVDPKNLEILKNARLVAEEWVTPTRVFEHVVPKLSIEVVDMTCTKQVISAVIEDVNREGLGEFEPGPTVNAEIGKRTAQLLKQYLADKLKGMEENK